MPTRSSSSSTSWSAEPSTLLKPPRNPSWMPSALRTLSRTVSEPNASRRWKVRPIPRRARRCTGSRVMLRPSKRTVPWLGFWSPLITLKQVVLPAPLGPIRPVIRPASAVKAAWSTAVTPPNWTTTSSTSSSDMRAHLLVLRAVRRAVRRAVLGEARGDVLPDRDLVERHGVLGTVVGPAARQRQHGHDRAHPVAEPAVQQPADGEQLVGEAVRVAAEGHG